MLATPRPIEEEAEKVKMLSGATYVRLLFIIGDECFIDNLAYQLINLVGVKGRFRVPFCSAVVVTNGISPQRGK